MTRVAAIDCGTNSIRLLIAEQDPTGRLVDLDRRLEIVRLGQGVDATGHFHPDALARTLAAVDSYGQLIEAAGVSAERIHFVATSAARDARNHAEFFGGVEQRLGVVPDVISGELEGQLSFTGALSRVRPTAGPVLVMDIGGGSTEFVFGATEAEGLVSVDVGCVRLTERYLESDPPAPEELHAAISVTESYLEDVERELPAIRGARCIVGVAGTVTTVAAVELGLADDEQRVADHDPPFGLAVATGPVVQ